MLVHLVVDDVIFLFFMAETFDYIGQWRNFHNQGFSVEVCIGEQSQQEDANILHRFNEANFILSMDEIESILALTGIRWNASWIMHVYSCEQ